MVSDVAIATPLICSPKHEQTRTASEKPPSCKPISNDKAEKKIYGLDEIQKYFHPTEWVMIDFLNLCLETLDMDDMGLTSIPKSIKEIEYFVFREVQAVSFNRNLNIKGSEVFGEFSSLQAINMSECSLKSIPESWSKLTKLSFLGLSGNQDLFQGSFSSIKHMMCLQWLDLGNCGLKSIPNEVYSLSNHLVVLALGYNKEVNFENSSLEKFRKLKRLSLNGCNLTKVPDGVYDLEQLRHLHLDDNEIKSFTQDILKLKNLIQLTVAENDNLRFPKLISRLEKIRRIVVDDDFNIQSTSFSIRSKLKHASEVNSVYDAF